MSSPVESDEELVLPLRINIPPQNPPYKPKALIHRFQIHKHCGTITFIVIQAFLIVVLLKISLNNPVYTEDILIGLCVIGSFYCASIAIDNSYET
jgi:hypothetical protein